jgi:hypothetical protein
MTGGQIQEIVAAHPEVFIEALEIKLNVRHVPEEYNVNGESAPVYVPNKGEDVLGPSYTIKLSPGAVAKEVKLN